MASNSLVFNQDIRSAAQDYKRDSEHKHKWGHGEARGPGRLPTAHARPSKPAFRPIIEKQHAAKSARRQVIETERVEAFVDSSGDEEPVEPCAAPAPDSEITYSYDASRGPGHGSQILGQALERALLQFENNATERLLKDEYEVLNADGESVGKKRRKSSNKAAAAASSEEEDDYEFV